MNHSLFINPTWFVANWVPWFRRDGGYLLGNNASVFAFDYGSGINIESVSFRDIYYILKLFHEKKRRI